MKKTRFLRSAAVLSAGGILAKGLGAVYRIALSGLIGGYGMGLYQLAYPLFCLLLTFSSSGIPAALSREIAHETARGGDGAATLRSALGTFAVLGLTGTALMCLLAPLMSRLQGESALLPCYAALAPSVLLVALIAVLRGYFQGINRMLPTAASELLEQLVKTGFGLFFALRFAGEPRRAVFFCLLGVTVSELAALLYLFGRLQTRKTAGRPLLRHGRSGAPILRAALPVMAAAGLLPLSQTVDSVLLVRLLGADTGAVALYGLFTGGVLPLVSLPATACYGLAAASVPAVSRAFARGEEREGRSRAVYALLATVLLALPCALGLFFFAEPLSRLLCSVSGERETFIRLLRLSSLSAVTLAGTDTLSACLTGMGRAKKAAQSMLFAVLLKLLLQLLLVPVLSIGGAAIAANACYPVAFFLDLFYTVRKRKERVHDHGGKSRNGDGRADTRGAADAEGGGRGRRSHRAHPVGTDA